MKHLSIAAISVEGQPMFKMLDKVQKLERTGNGILHFELGEPNFDTPPNIVEAACHALKNGETHYTSSMGLYAFREVVQQTTQISRGFMPDIEQILVTPGANPAQAVAMGNSIFDITLRFDEMVLEYLQRHPACRYIFLSSGAAYGSSFDEPVDENTKAVIAINNLQPQDWYAVAKLHAECRHRSLLHLPIVDVRVFNYFSHTQDMEARFLITDILRAIKNSETLNIAT